MKRPSHPRRPSSEFRSAMELAICADRSTAAATQCAAKSPIVRNMSGVFNVLFKFGFWRRRFFTVRFCPQSADFSQQSQRFVCAMQKCHAKESPAMFFSQFTPNGLLTASGYLRKRVVPRFSLLRQRIRANWALRGVPKGSIVKSVLFGVPGRELARV